MAPYRIAVLASGSGSLFQALIDHNFSTEVEIVGLISDIECQAIARAKTAKIPALVIEVGTDRVKWDVQLAKALEQMSPDLVISAGFMRLIGPAVLNKFEGRIINTHPALLPSFPGAHAVRDALKARVTKTGCTIHFVDAGLDTGEVIAQTEVHVLANDDENSLHERIKQQERKLLVSVVSDFVSGKIRTKSRS